VIGSSIGEGKIDGRAIDGRIGDGTVRRLVKGNTFGATIR
jgi:hypothetical protein